MVRGKKCDVNTLARARTAAPNTCPIELSRKQPIKAPHNSDIAGPAGLIGPIISEPFSAFPRTCTRGGQNEWGAEHVITLPAGQVTRKREKQIGIFERLPFETAHVSYYSYPTGST